MRTLIALVTVAVVLLPRTGSAQIVQPSGVPIVYQGGLYYPSGPTVFFDGSLMVRVGTFEGLPIYLDPSREPVNVVLVPIGGKLMRPYERTNGAIQAELVYPPPPLFPDAPEPPYDEPRVSRLDRFAQPPPSSSGAALAPVLPVRGGPASRGLWIQFNGRMWTPVGPGRERSPRLAIVGNYFGFPVYQEPARRDRIYVPANEGGPLIQYDRRPE